ncbi:MAG: hypothetical protein IT261_04405, partial [Saprospiraceae bacterium]|nr:hypothetical protein [Saprospiraceae bacterium]
MENVLLQGFQQGNLEDQYFAQIQTINSARLSDPEFVLSPAQEETLLGIANSSSLEAGYAQTMLGILTGRVFMPKLPALMEERSNNSQTLQLSKVGVLLVSPNPANDVINIQLPKAIDRSANRILELRD